MPIPSGIGVHCKTGDAAAPSLNAVDSQTALPQLRPFQCFVGDASFAAKGNLCLVADIDVSLDPATVYQAILKAIPDLFDSAICCCQWLPNQQLWVSCYQRGKAIQCCGHGLLAASKRRLLQDANTSLTLRMGESLLSSDVEGNKVRLRFKPLQLFASATPSWLSACQPDVQPIDCARAGDEGGYMLVIWPDHCELSLLKRPSLAHLADAAYAVIYSRRLNDAVVEMRYFAPQFAVAEDQATGSAARVLASYWRQSELTIHQVSVAGGLIFTRYCATEIEVLGYCQALSSIAMMESADE